MLDTALAPEPAAILAAANGPVKNEQIRAAVWSSAGRTWRRATRRSSLVLDVRSVTRQTARLHVGVTDISAPQGALHASVPPASRSHVSPGAKSAQASVARLDGIEALRCVAAVMIVVYHAVELPQLPIPSYLKRDPIAFRSGRAAVLHPEAGSCSPTVIWIASKAGGK